MLGRLRVSQQLYGAFAIVLAMTAIVGGIALDGVGRTHVEAEVLASKWLRGVGYLATARTAALESRNYEVKHGHTEDRSYHSEYEEKMVEAANSVTSATAAYESLMASEAERNLFVTYKKNWAAYGQAQQKVVALGRDKKRADAGDISDGMASAAADDVIVALDALTAYNFNAGKAAGEQAAMVSARTTQVVWAFLGAALLSGMMLAWGITRRLLGQLGGEPQAAAQIALAVAAGDLGTQIQLKPGDRKSLMASMAKMQTEINSFVAAQAEMKKQHDAGTSSYRVPVAQFTGSYREMAEMSNELVASHIAVSTRVVEIVRAYAKGDLSMDMDRLPGEKAKITEAINEVKASLQSINGEISKLVEAAVQGDLKVRGNTEAYQYDFKKMVQGLNQLMQVSDSAVDEVMRVLGALAKGDLTETITNDYQGSFGQLKDDSNETVARLTDIVGQLRDATKSINTAAKEIATGNTDLSQRTEEQASSLEETASSMEELTSTVKQNAENAKQANHLAIGASEVAVKGGNVVSQVVTTMSSINESSKKIVDIISVIDGIAFQTNILALNAAVEAARAGEQGRGFAVVATEVRNLAQRSAAAAKEIKTLISDSVEKVGTGTQLVDEAGKTMAEIVSSVKRVTDIMGEITAASQEQSTGIEQVNQAITQMDEVTQQNAALVEQAAAAAESLEEQAQVLARTVGVFKLDANGRSSNAVKPAAVRAGPASVTHLPKRATAGLKRSVVSNAKAASGGDWSQF